MDRSNDMRGEPRRGDPVGGESVGGESIRERTRNAGREPGQQETKADRIDAEPVERGSTDGEGIDEGSQESPREGRSRIRKITERVNRMLRKRPREE